MAVEENNKIMDSLEFLIRKRLGQKKFNPLHERRHKRFDFSFNNKKNDNIINLFDDFEFNIDEESGSLLEISKLRFYKGECFLLYEMVHISDTFDVEYSDVVLKDYSGYGTVEIIKDIILNYSTNYKEIIRDFKLKQLI
jgi:hypothetical protein